MKTKLLHNLSNYCHGAMLSLLLTIITGLVIHAVNCKHPPWAIPCHPLVLRWCGWRLAGRPWCRGPCCSAPGPPHPSCCSCPAPAPAPAPLVTTNEVKIPALGTLLCCRCGWRPPRTDHSAHCRLLGGLLGHSALVRVKGAIVRAVTGHPWSLDVATIACRASARCLAHVTVLHSGPRTSRAAARLSAVYS